jgi:hypothetical protein
MSCNTKFNRYPDNIYAYEDFVQKNNLKIILTMKDLCHYILMIKLFDFCIFQIIHLS